jgi:hypothetical protein
MTSITKKVLSALAIPALMTTLTTLGMEPEHSPLFLESMKKTNDLLYANCSIMLADGVTQATSYCMQTVHDAILEHSNIHSHPKDPVILCIVKKHSANNSFAVPLPAKLFIDCTDGFRLQLYESDASKLYKSHPIFKKKHLMINAMCTKNPRLIGNSFAEQFNNAMNEFYTNPGFPWEDQGHRGELANAGIMTEKQIGIRTLQFGPNGFGNAIFILPIYGHGPNGCPNEEYLKKSTIENPLKSLMYRQMHGSFPKK